MSELKPGDRVWIRGFYVEWATDNTRHISDLDDPETAIPDVPNLAAVARVLAAHPDGFMAIGRVVGNIEGEQKGESEGVWDYNDAELGFLRALAAALNGGTA